LIGSGGTFTALADVATDAPTRLASAAETVAKKSTVRLENTESI